MLKFDQVLHARLDGLDQAVTAWGETVSKLTKTKEKAETGLRTKSDKADWKGRNAGVTQEFVRRTAKEFGDALTEATSIRNILRDPRGEFKAAKGALEKCVTEVPGKGVRNDPDGTVSHLIHPDRRADDYDGPKPTEADFEAMRAAVKAALDRANDANDANDADDVASRALRGPGIAYANAPGWSETDRNYLDEELVNYVRSARTHSRDNSLPDPYEKD
ncbi:hypothetical protein ACF065_19065 [Streptomyces sp. NPDC015232]|uniref:hypothetical protein n=1 Tax=unclassified Streptomyces TaxID=2593676 RepID=UPI0036FC55DE